MPFPEKLKLELVENGKRCWRTADHFFYVTRQGVTLMIPKGTRTDGASIPRFFWRVIGDPMNTDYVEAVVLHDFLWREAIQGRTTFRPANRLFREALAELGVTPWRRRLMWAAVSLNSLRFRLSSFILHSSSFP